MKKILLFMLFVICGSLPAGPVTVTTSTLTMLSNDNLAIKPLPLTADLKVSEERVTGVAEGPAIELERLIRAAITNALGQDKPSVDGPDVLVGMNVFTAQTGNDMTVTVTGYPAYYTNFRTAEEKESAGLNIVIPEQGVEHITLPANSAFDVNMSDKKMKMMNSQNVKNDNAEMEMNSTDAERTAAKVKKQQRNSMLIGIPLGIAAVVLYIILIVSAANQ